MMADLRDRPAQPSRAWQHVVMGWLADIAVSYVSGIAIGAPLGLIAVRMSGAPIALSIVIVVTMCGTLVYRRFPR